MTDVRKAADSDVWEQLRPFLHGVLPVGDETDLLIALSEGWRRSTGAAEAYVSLLAPKTGRLVGFHARAGLSPRSLDFDAAGPDVWAAESVRDLLSGADVLDDGDRSRGRAVPFGPSETAISGVVLVFDSAAAVDHRLIDALQDLSARCVAQVRSASRSAEDFASRLLEAKLESMAEFAAGAGHEINNPLATIIGRVQLLLRGETDPQRRQALETIGGQAYRVRDMIGDAMLFARPPAPERTAVDLGATVEEVLIGQQDLALSRGCELIVDSAAEVIVDADPVQLAVVISCLIRNAIEACVDGGAIRIGASSAEVSGRAHGCLTVHDRGIGLTVIEREHLFDPFFSGRQAGRGLGFGLSKAWRIVKQHGGEIGVSSDPEQGTTATVLWPMASSDVG